MNINAPIFDKLFYKNIHWRDLVSHQVYPTFLWDSGKNVQGMYVYLNTIYPGLIGYTTINQHYSDIKEQIQVEIVAACTKSAHMVGKVLTEILETPQLLHVEIGQSKHAIKEFLFFLGSFQFELLQSKYPKRTLEQLNPVVEELKSDPFTRRATISILDGFSDNKLLEPLRSGEISKAEYPCTESITFMIRNNRLHIYVFMRSQNMYNVFPYDYYNFISLRDEVFMQLKEHYPALQVGKFYSTVKFCHVYEKFEEQINTMTNAE